MYKNMKIEITDEVQLNAVCDVLKSMGYVRCYKTELDINFVIAFHDKTFGLFTNDISDEEDLTTLTDLLALRDKQFMEKLNAAD